MAFSNPPAENETARRAQRVAFFGGSFDPPHLGHLAVAKAAQAALHLDSVLFAPVGAQPLKPQGSSADFKQRIAMTRLAIAGEPAFAVSLADAPQPGGVPNYSWQTLSGLRNQLSDDSHLFFLMGADSFAGLRRWFRAEALPFLAPLIVASRPGEQLDDLCALLPSGLSLELAAESEDAAKDESLAVPLQKFLVRNRSGATAPFYLLPDLAVEISATRIREQLRREVANGAQNLLPAAVVEYIRSQKLYQ